MIVLLIDPITELSENVLQNLDSKTNIVKKKFFDNITYNLSNRINPPECIWYSNNGLSWHTLFKIENVTSININDELHIMYLPTMIFHIHRNMRSLYTIDIFFQNNFCGKSDFVESFVNKIEFKITDVNNYLNNSINIINAILDKGFLSNPAIEKYLKLSNDEQHKYIDSLPIKSFNSFIGDWQREIKSDVRKINKISGLVSDIGMVPKYQNIDELSTSKNKNIIFLNDKLYKVGQILTIKNNKYKIIATYIPNNEKCLGISNFKDSYLLLLDMNNNKKVKLMIPSILKKTEIDPKLIIGKYMFIENKYNMITKIKKLDKFGTIKYEFNTGRTLEENRNFWTNEKYNIESIYDILSIEDKNRNKLISLCNVCRQLKLVIDTKNISDEKYKLEDLYQIDERTILPKIHIDKIKIICDRIGFDYNNKNNNLSITDDQNYSKLFYNNKSNQIDTYVGGHQLYLLKPNTITDKSMNFWYVYTPSNILEYKQIINELYYNNLVDVSNIIKTKVKNNTEMMLPFQLNGEVFEKHKMFLCLVEKNSHISTNNAYFELMSIQQIYNSNLSGIEIKYKTINNNLKSIVVLNKWRREFNCIVPLYDNIDLDIEGIEIGYIGKVKMLMAKHNFYKSKKYEIIAFTKIDDRKYAIFNNGIFVNMELINEADFAPPSKRNKKSDDIEILSKQKLYNIKYYTKKYLGKYIKTECLYTNNNYYSFVSCVIDDI